MRFLKASLWRKSTLFALWRLSKARCVWSWERQTPSTSLPSLSHPALPTKASVVILTSRRNRITGLRIRRISGRTLSKCRWLTPTQTNMTLKLARQSSRCGTRSFVKKSRMKWPSSMASEKWTSTRVRRLRVSPNLVSPTKLRRLNKFRKKRRSGTRMIFLEVEKQPMVEQSILLLRSRLAQGFILMVILTATTRLSWKNSRNSWTRIMQMLI